jgi:hypothetical protein
MLFYDIEWSYKTNEEWTIKQHHSGAMRGKVHQANVLMLSVPQDYCRRQKTIAMCERARNNYVSHEMKMKSHLVFLFTLFVVSPSTLSRRLIHLVSRGKFAQD